MSDVPLSTAGRSASAPEATRGAWLRGTESLASVTTHSGGQVGGEGLEVSPGGLVVLVGFLPTCHS